MNSGAKTPPCWNWSARPPTCSAARQPSFVPSGTMGNLTSMLALTERGDTVIVDGLSHMVGENGNYAVVAGCTLLTVETDGVLDADMVRERLDSSTIPPAPARADLDRKHPQRARGRVVGPGRDAGHC